MICKCAFVYNAEGEQREISKRAKFFLPKLIVSSKLFFFEKIKNRKINSIHFLLYNNSCIKRKLVFTVAINSPIFKVRRDVKYDQFKILTQYRGVIRPRHPHTTDSSILAPGYSSNPDAAKKCCASTKAGIYIYIYMYPIHLILPLFLLHFTPSISPLEILRGEIFKNRLQPFSSLLTSLPVYLP